MKGHGMFFLLRCAFWLGLVFLNMDWKIDGPLLPSTEDVARQASAQCLANPQVCAQVVAGAQSLVGAQAVAASQDLLLATVHAPAAAEPKEHLQVAQKSDRRGEAKAAQKTAAGH
jgi:hypothetical protein